MIRQLKVVSLALTASAHAAIIRVPSDQSTIQDGLDVAAEGDTVLVEAGTYTGPGNRDLDFGGINRVLVSEGGAGATVIDCEGAGRGFKFHRGETEASVVSGFTVTGGLVESLEGGGRIFCDRSSPTIDECTIVGNSAPTRGANGGGVYCTGASPIIMDSNISDNSAGGSSGGMMINTYGGADPSAPTVSGCTISGNSSNNSHGGGIAWYRSHGTATDCTITDNWAKRHGGGMFLDGSQPRLKNCTIVGNSALIGGGMSCYAASAPTISMCVIMDNSAIKNGHSGGMGGGVYCDYRSSSSPRFSNCTMRTTPVGLAVGFMSVTRHGQPSPIARLRAMWRKRMAGASIAPWRQRFS